MLVFRDDYGETFQAILFVVSSLLIASNLLKLTVNKLEYCRS
jgi:hypothetical protein